MKIEEIFKKFRLPILIGGGFLALIAIFAVGLLIGWTLHTAQRAAQPDYFGFRTVYNAPEDFRVVEVHVHLSSVALARRLQEDYADSLATRLRQILHQHFEQADANTFSESGEALVPTSDLELLIRQSFEANIRDLDDELRQLRGELVLAVTIYFVPEGR